jgi:integrase
MAGWSWLVEDAADEGGGFVAVAAGPDVGAVSGRPPGAPAITSPAGALLGLENWKRSTGWRAAIAKIDRPKMRVHDLRHTYASLARRAGADLRLLQKTMGHASITVTAHVYADLYDDELDVVASALDALDDRPSE